MSRKMSDFSKGINEIIIADVVSGVRDDEKYNRVVENHNSEEYRLYQESRDWLQEYDRFERDQLESRKIESELMRQNLYNLIIRQCNLGVENAEITFDDILAVMTRNKALLEKLKQESDLFLTPQKIIGVYENMFIDLVNEDIRFSAFAPTVIFKNKALKMPKAKIIALSDDDCQKLYDCLSENGILDSKEFKANHSKLFSDVAFLNTDLNY